MRQRRLLAFLFGLCVIPAFFYLSGEALAKTEIEQLQEQISERNNRLAEIEKEIAQFEIELQKVGSEKSSLKKAISQLELERKKVNADIAATENQISSTDLEINKLALEIGKTEDSILTNQEAIADIIRKIEKADQDTLIEVLLEHKNISDFWLTIEQVQHIRDQMVVKVSELTKLQALLTDKKDASTEERANLVTLKDQYHDQNQVLVNNKAEQTELLQATQSKEANYQQLLAEKKAARDQIEKEMRDFEAKLQFILDPSSIPTPGTTVFNWPVDNVIITQLFGGTEFAKNNASVYGGRAYHPGVDFGAPRGTQIKAPLAGVVRDTGNTDAVPGCYSWGKWTLIDHANGLSTLYAHQDVVSVSPGQKVETGQVIGYIGSTGYSTGPHLHFTVYAKAGVSIRQFNEIKTVTSCGPAKTPVAATDAYIDPMLYLPPY